MTATIRSANFCTPIPGWILIAEMSPGVLAIRLATDADVADGGGWQRAKIEFSAAANIVVDCLRQSFRARLMESGQFRIPFDAAIVPIDSDRTQSELVSVAWLRPAQGEGRVLA